MGTQARTPSCQLRTQRVRHLGEIGGCLHRPETIRLGIAIAFPVTFCIFDVL